MKTNNFTATISVILIVLLIINLVLFALNKMNHLSFWLIIIVVGLIAYKLMPRIKS